MTPAVDVRNVTKRFASTPALANVTLDVAPRESVVVLGPSGCGKTTLLRLLAGLEVPDDGDVFLQGVHVSSAGRCLVAPHRRGIGFVFQDLALWPHLTVEEHLLFVMESSGVPRGDRAAACAAALELARVDRLSVRYPHELSGGEQQRVAVARALAARPRILLLDEPLSSLDPDLRASLRAELQRLRRALEITMVYVTHDREDAAVLADRVIALHAGRVVSDRAAGGGTP